MEDLPITDEDLQAALREMKTYVDITEDDLKKIFAVALKHAKERLAATIPVREVMTPKVIAVRADAPVRDVVALLSENRISGLPVVDQENRVIGMVTEADILAMAGIKREQTFKEIVRRILGEPASRPKAGNKAGEIMTTPATTTGPEVDIRVVARTLDEKRIKRLPVEDEENRLIGIISRADIVRAMGQR
jgi:CBS domain-containing protein